MHRALRLRRASAATVLPRWRATRSSSSATARAVLLRSTQSSSLQNSRRSHPTPQLTDEQRESIVKILKARCNALYDDNEAYVSPDEALPLWLHDMQTLQRQYASSQLNEEAARAYESGVAIASKQRQFELAAQLTQQMQQLGVRPTERIRQYLIRNVALELISSSKHTSLQDLREILKDVSEDMWQREIMSVVEREERPLQLKTDKEFALFHERLIGGIEAQLDEYERSLGASNAKELKLTRSTVPYNEALRVYADNGVKFSRMLQLMVTRDIVVDVETYEALLLGARWNEIPATLSQLLDSKIVEELTSAASAASSDHVRTLWVNAMKAIVYSSTERFNSLSASVYKRDVDQLRKVFMFVDKQLSSAFPKFNYATSTQYDEVYTMRTKAAAACGLIAPVKRILDEYIEYAPLSTEEKPVLSKQPFLAALEIFPWSLMDVLMLSRESTLARAESRDVATSPRVVEMRLMYDRIMRTLTKAQKTIDEINSKKDAEDAALDENELRELLSQQNHANQIIGQESRRATTVERRLDNARVLKANQLLIKEYLKRGDKTVEYVLDKLLDAGFDVENDLDVSVKLMEQYMKAARRLDRRLTQRQKHASLHMMQRVFTQANAVSGTVQSGGLDMQDPETREKLTKFFEHAVCAAVRFWREEETDALVRQQQRLLGTTQLAPREYDQLIFQRVTSLDVRGAHSLLQEMHNAGMKPSQEAIHRIALGLLYQPLDYELSAMLNVSDREAIEQELGLRDALKLDGDDEKRSAESAAAARSLLLGSDAPVMIEDLIGFLQDWYNLYGVEPVGKTVVPVLAQLLDASNYPEFRRLLQILETMDGGLTPATQLWLEKRLEQLGGKTLDDFRL
ncbi:uncharacterized protein PITG_16430 [Phytophthora infestans T30-4]|uniref:Uncharacterized protein n=1 Tax=Phytophthora infestans (strain T30-4) TaxID=403677 RepID=D0NTM0_PHYIT|nr:uncharacterized protein PITG_16430 [Phytophthora infestans T30-4]EEY64982.1 conserved hypothetical protein [Phytophthora infestans T30-4]|eukprot:XP_002897470.1 conserved hypothetical protein [Phytophthora infestans T30-4]